MQTSAQPFPERVEQAQANPDRMAAIRRAAVRFYDNRLNALTSLPDPDATRDLARQIRAHTIAHLDQYLLQFEEAVQANGGQVHWATDAASAQAVGAVSDGVVIGTRLIQLLEGQTRDNVALTARQFMAEIRAALDAI